MCDVPVGASKLMPDDQEEETKTGKETEADGEENAGGVFDVVAE